MFVLDRRHRDDSRGRTVIAAANERGVVVVPVTNQAALAAAIMAGPSSRACSRRLSRPWQPKARGSTRSMLARIIPKTAMSLPIQTVRRASQSEHAVASGIGFCDQAYDVVACR